MDEKKILVRDETISSRKKDRLIYKVIDELTTTDILLVTEMSRLARSFSECQKIVQNIQEK